MWIQNCKQSLKVVPVVYNRLAKSFMSLAWPWSGRSLPQGEPVEVLVPRTGVQYGWAPCPPATYYLTSLQPDRLIFCHMAGWLANCSWLTAYCTKCQPDLPLGRNLLWPSVWLLWSHRLWSDVPLPDRDISLLSLVLLQAGWPLVRCTPRQGHLVAKCATILVRLTSGHMYPLPKIRLWVRFTSGKASVHADLWWGVPQRHLVGKCDTTSGHCSEKPHFVSKYWDN